MVPNTDDSGDDSPGTGGAAAGNGDTAASVDSKRWYWVAALSLYWVVATVAGSVFTLVVLAFAVTGVASVGTVAGEPTVAITGGLGLVGLVLVALAILLVFVGGVLSLVFPVAIYLDAEAVTDARLDWQPDPALYGLLGLAGVVAQPLQVPLAVYYLYKRHESVGRP
ncbi:hypothetical protein [Halobacterium jilantaiense]|uniref:Uncharacterized protein n=1 Tax=Halobacterium jilantaiense TaxID=355548 RepID=A0A1I0PSC4_9EURY|nr:hypothetical protein [Halobacterium jilantaiense]SEW17247.1 hypothetical protein SAMN04487945_1909 [Halobacterium jilantaiense]